MNRKFKNLGVGIVLVSLMVVAFLIAGCGSSATSAQDTAPTPTSASAVSATPAPSPTPTVAPTATPEPSSGDAGDLVSIGEKIFQETAGGVGCQYCHGPDAKGKEGLGINIIGRLPAEVTGALDRVELMGFIYLTNKEIMAVSAYLQSLGPRPPMTPTAKSMP